MTNRLLRRGFALLAMTFAVGCAVSADDNKEESGSVDSDLLNCPRVSGTDTNRSLVVTDSAILAQFPLKRTMDQIRTTANVASTQTTLDVWQRWFKSFGASSASGDCDDANVDPNHYGLRCPRTNELALASLDPFAAGAQTTFVPVALFNRFDLAPANGANCGEYRIVYAMRPNSTFNRGFLIFEGVLPNPTPGAGINACLPVARFWQGLTTDASVSSRAAKLVKFYFTGGAVAGFAPVVQAAHYGLFTNTGVPTSGQIRTNMFVALPPPVPPPPPDSFQPPLPPEWQLREFKTKRECTNPASPATCHLTFAHQTAKTNPAEELFAGTHAKSSSFQPSFESQVPGLAATTTVTGIRLGVADAFNEWESVSQASNVVYANSASSAMRSAIQSKLTAARSSLTPTNILDRATTQTCGGCHQQSNNQNLGGGLTWPASNGFTHVNEDSHLSPALTSTFLPRRKVVLESFINARCGGAPSEQLPTDDFTTIGGSAIGAAN